MAIGYTIFGSCRMHGANPLAWATDVIGRLQAGWPRERLDELLPDAWASSARTALAAGDADAT
ncbi:transposase domain-containing protein [Sorangium sp. So ce542]